MRLSAEGMILYYPDSLVHCGVNSGEILILKKHFKMKILILGSGGREHAITWKLAQSPKVTGLFIAPGNAGTSSLGTNIDVNPEDFEKVKEAYCQPERGWLLSVRRHLLVAGIHDFFLNDDSLKHIPVIGPQKEAAMLEGSKDFAKAFMNRHEIPTAAHRTFGIGNAGEARGFLESLQPPYVLKADGLAAGKGVVILNTIDEALSELDAMLTGKFGEAGSKVVIEQFLRGKKYRFLLSLTGNITGFCLQPRTTRGWEKVIPAPIPGAWEQYLPYLLPAKVLCTRLKKE